MRRLLVLLFLLALPVPALAEDRPRAGLLWNRSGLPATFPLVVRSSQGTDHVLYVTDPEDRAPVMAGYIRGGEVFRLLLPPGEWRLRFASGRDWQGGDRLFGPATAWTEMQDNVDLKVLGIDRRRAYVITLDDGDGATVIAEAREAAECQLVLWDSYNREWPDDFPGTSDRDRGLLERQPDEPREAARYGDRVRPKLRYVERDYDFYRRLCED